MAAQRAQLEAKACRVDLTMIEQVQYADGYIDTLLYSAEHRAIQAAVPPRGRTGGWIFSQTMRCTARVISLRLLLLIPVTGKESASRITACTLLGRRFADEIVSLLWSGWRRGTRYRDMRKWNSRLVKLAKLVEEYEGEGAGREVCGDGTAFGRQTW